MNKPAFLLILSISCTLSVWSQNITSSDHVLRGPLTNKIDPNASSLPFFSSTQDGAKIVDEIVTALGIRNKFRIRAADVPNVEATKRHHEDYILYNPSFIHEVNSATHDKWASIFILAHEIGHHIKGHTSIKLKAGRDIELEADCFAGAVLCRMGASLQDAQLVMYFISNPQASTTHPARTDRLFAIKKGWEDANAGSSGQVPMI